jgi:hypothetical protein
MMVFEIVLKVKMNDHDTEALVLNVSIVTDFAVLLKKTHAWLSKPSATQFFIVVKKTMNSNLERANLYQR